MTDDEQLTGLQALRLSAARVAAMEAGQYSAAAAAVKEIGVLSGIRIERSERGLSNEFVSMGVDQLRDWILREIAVLGLGEQVEAGRRGASKSAH